MNKKPNLLIFTENFEKRILAEGVENITNLEGFLNNESLSGKNRIILKGVQSYFRTPGGIYKQKDHQRNFQILNVNHIDFIYGASNLVFTKSRLTNHDKVSVLWGMKGLHHALIGEVKVPGKYVPKLKRDSPKQKVAKAELELITYLDKQLQRNFISFYKPRQDSEDGKKEFVSLFSGLNIDPEKISKVLINNKKQSNSNTSQAVYLGITSQNYIS